MRALIAMSGGVDSSVSAKLTQDAGYECTGCTMRLFGGEPDAKTSSEPGGSPEQTSRPCGSSDDAEDARRVADRLGMPFHIFDFRNEFRCKVIEPFIESYSMGRTPNPCIDCNREFKFGALMECAGQFDCDCVVTGHYARIERDEATGKYLLKKAKDLSKDQSYVLYNLTQEQLAHVRFPLGGLTKAQVRNLAQENGFVNAEKPESQDICFVPDGDYAAMIRRYSGLDFPQGEFVDLDGKVMGTHKGIIHYTIGQTRRLGQAFGRPRYVVRIDAASNRIVLGGPEDVYSSYAKAGRFNWISGEIPEGEIRCRVKTRYRQQEQWAVVRPVREAACGNSGCENAGCGDGGEANAPHIKNAPAEHGAPIREHFVEIFFDEPQRAITPGQAAVLYDGDTVLGGGTILQV